MKRRPVSGRIRFTLSAVTLAALGATAGVTAPCLAGAAQAEEARIIILRKVPPRTAFRKAPPGPTLNVRPSRAREIVDQLDGVVPVVGFVKNVEAATISTGIPVGTVAPTVMGFKSRVRGLTGGMTQGLVGGQGSTAAGGVLRGLEHRFAAVTGSAIRRVIDGATSGLTGTIQRAVVAR